MMALVLAVLTCVVGHAQTLDVYYQAKRFAVPATDQAYVDVYFTIPGVGLSVPADEDPSVVVRVAAVQDDSVHDARAYRLVAPVADDGSVPNASDLVRLAVSPGPVRIDLDLRDAGDSLRRFQTSVDLVVPGADAPPLLSDVMLVREVVDERGPDDAFRRGDKAIVPKFVEYYPTGKDRLRCYAEVYPDTALGDLVLRAFVQDEMGTVLDRYGQFVRIDGRAGVHPVVLGFDISDLPTGNYFLALVLTDRDQVDHAFSQVFFQRLNQRSDDAQQAAGPDPMWGPEGENFAEKYDLVNIRHHLDALQPIATPGEAQTILGLVESEEIELMHRFFYTFWWRRDEADPEAAWMDYAERLQLVERRYTNALLRGYETDRGRMYLRYGEPDEMLEFRATEFGHHEVWWYRELEGFANVPFVFINRNDIADEFMMVHSGHPDEVFDEVWSRRLQTDTRY